MKRIILPLILLLVVSCNGKVRTALELTPGIYILDDQKPVKTVDELASMLNGKGAYIDRWATWCSPCLEEFRHSDTLHLFLDSRKIVMVYLNSDAEIDKDTLFTFIKNHDLKGFHLRMNDDLKADLLKKGIFVPLIPQYMIMDRDGIIIENKALRPGNGMKLYNQLDSLLHN